MGVIYLFFCTKKEGNIMNEMMNIVIVGHVDHGKSTIIGRLLADTKSLPEGKLDQVKANCELNSKPFEYAFLLDALKDEQSQGITIDSARIFFKSNKRHYIIIDAPGHIEFLKNMITGAARAEAALLVIDADEGVQENSRRHGYMLAMLGIKQVAVLVNKMDLVEYNQKVFENIVKEYSKFLKEIGIEARSFVPVCGREGDMIFSRKDNLDWYKGETVLNILDSFEKQRIDEKLPFRMPIQGVYKFTKHEDDRRIIAGTVETGVLKTGDEVVFYPSGKRSIVETIESFNTSQRKSVSAGMATGFTIKEQLYIKRGEVVTIMGEKHPEISSRIKVSLFWLGKDEMIINKDYSLKIGTVKVPARLQSIQKTINASDLSSDKKAKSIKRHEVAECILELGNAIAFDMIDELATTSRFVIVDNYHICGGGIIKEAIEDDRTILAESVFERNFKWIKSNISQGQRADKFGQNPALIIVTGEEKSARKDIARKLEEYLIENGKIAYFLGIGSVIHGVDADIDNSSATHKEHLRRLAEIANIILDAGVILVVSASELSQEDVNMFSRILDYEGATTIWVGDKRKADFIPDLIIKWNASIKKAIEETVSLLRENNIL